MKYTIDCPNCGIIHNNNSEVYCDECGNPFERMKFGDVWYDVDELEKDNPYN